MRKLFDLRALAALFGFVLGGLSLGGLAQAAEPPASSSMETAPKELVPPGVEQILPRGHIPAIVDPKFVSAEEAEIADDAWVLGVALEGQARAYSLNILNHHEIVNDRVGEQTFAAVWCPLANTAVVYDRTFDDKTLTFEASGALLNASLVMRDRETDSWWSIMTSKGIGGALENRDLVELAVSEKAQWKDWKKRHPETLVLSVDGAEHVDKNPYDRYFENEATFRDMEITDQRLPAKTPIFSFWLDGKPWAVPHEAFAGGNIFSGGALGTRRLMLYRKRGASIFESTRAFLLEPGSSASSFVDMLPKADTLGESFLGTTKSSTTRPLDPLAGFDTFWYNWVAVNKDTQLLR